MDVIINKWGLLGHETLKSVYLKNEVMNWVDFRPDDANSENL